jgi:nuclear RNA export factor
MSRVWCFVQLSDVQPTKSPIYTLSLAGNEFHHLHQLSRLPSSLPYLRALDLSNNPIVAVQMLDELLSSGERKGKANAGTGGLKNLIELKLNGCTFRENTLEKPNGDETYQQWVHQCYCILALTL